MIYLRNELASDLRELSAHAVGSHDDLKGWYAHAQAVQAKLMQDASVSMGMSDFIWHYLSDADIRFKDRGYAQEQEARLFEVIAELERDVARRASSSRSAPLEVAAGGEEHRR